MKSNPLSKVLSAHVDSVGPISCPLVLISQISRSGGSYLSQLFDGHSQLWAHPHELHVGHPHKWNWPDLSGAANEDEAFGILQQKRFETKFSEGFYSKGNDQQLPMVYDSAAHRELFVLLAQRQPARSDREWLNLYFTSLFYTWLDYQHRYSEKRFVAAFASMFSIERASMQKFREAYPDGFVISVLREPVGWYASVKQRSISAPRKQQQVYAEGIQPYAGLEKAEAAYIENAEAILRNRQLLGERLILVDYTTLVKETAATMRGLAARLGLDFQDILLRQTFNGMPIAPNSSFIGDAAGRRSSVLTEEDLARVREGPMMARYQALLPFCDIGL